MPDIVAVVTVMVLVAIGLIHFYWAFGGTVGLAYAVPTQDGTPLFRPGRWLTVAVGLVLLGFGMVAYLLHFFDLREFSRGAYLLYAGWVISAVFLLRAVGEFKAVGFFKTIKGSPFARYDTLIYSPLCLEMGSVFAALSHLASS